MAMDDNNPKPMEDEESYKAGHKHGEAGESRNDNPYNKDVHEEYKRWDWGWVHGIIIWLKNIGKRP